MEYLIQNMQWYHIVIALLSIIIIVIFVKYRNYKAHVCDTYHKDHHYIDMEKSWSEKTSSGKINHYVKKCRKCGRTQIIEKRSNSGGFNGYLT